MILGFPTTKQTLSRDLSYEGVPTSHLLLINLFTEFHHPYRFYMLHDDIPHILIYILIWLIFRFPNVKYANTKHRGAVGINLVIAHSIFSSFFCKSSAEEIRSKATAFLTSTSTLCLFIVSNSAIHGSSGSFFLLYKR